MKEDRHRYPVPPQNIYAHLPQSVTGAEPISDLADFWLQVECACGAIDYPLRLLSAKIGWKVPLASAVKRLKCSKCGGRPSRVALIERSDGDGHTTARGREIELLANPGDGVIHTL